MIWSQVSYVGLRLQPQRCIYITSAHVSTFGDLFDCHYGGSPDSDLFRSIGWEKNLLIYASGQNRIVLQDSICTEYLR